MSRISRSLAHVAHLAPGLLATIAVHHRALRTFFAQDDITFLSRAAGLEPRAELARVLSTDLAFRAQHACFGLAATGYHVVNLLLHLLNVVGVYALGLRLGRSRGVAAAAAICFGASSIAFTPLNWASGVIELLTASLLMGATLVHLEAERRGDAWRWAAAVLALAAMLSKETAIVWIFAVATIEWCRGGAFPKPRSLAPGIVVTLVAVCGLLFTGARLPIQPSSPYALSLAPAFLANNLSTYAKWTAAIWDPIRDVVAVSDPGAWKGVLMFVMLGAALFGRGLAGLDAPARIGFAWWLVCLLPVLPLAHHSYLYYLYIPWVGGSIAVASVAATICRRWPQRIARPLGAVALLGTVVLEAHNAGVRATAARRGLPIDRTIRDSELLRHSLAGLRAAALPPGTRVGFVNPVPGGRFDLMTGAPTPADSASVRTSYVPLEAAMRNGETLALFVPGLRYAGFASTIPDEWTDVECFFYEQRGYLARWGKGEAARLEQARVLLSAGRSLPGVP